MSTLLRTSVNVLFRFRQAPQKSLVNFPCANASIVPSGESRTTNDRTRLQFQDFRTLHYFNGVNNSCELCRRTQSLSPLSHKNSVSRSVSSIVVASAPNLSVSQVKKLLKDNGISFDDGFTCLVVECPVCKHTSNITRHSKVYVNKRTGSSVCFQCGYSSQWEALEKILISSKKQKIALTDIEALKNYCVVDDIISAQWKKIAEQTVLLTSYPDTEVFEILIRFGLPDVPIPALNSVQVRIDSGRSTLYFPLFNAGGHVAGYKICDRGGSEETVPAVGCCGFLGISPSRTPKNESAVLVSSVKDALALSGQRLTAHTICLPYGETALPQSILPAFERFGKIVLWFGSSVQCWDAARNVAKKLGEVRCHFVRPTEGAPAPHEALSIGADLKALVVSAQPIWHRAITTFTALRQDVLAELQNSEKVQGVKWKRFPSLNRILKGHRRGEFTVLTGPTGCGKTTFMSEYSLDLASQGVTTLWGSFEIRNIRLARTMLHQLACIPIDNHLDQFEHWADEFERLPIYFMTFHGQQTVRVVMEAVEHAAYVHDIAHVIIDNVQFMMGLSEDSPKNADRFWKQDSIIAAFRNFATRANVHVTLVMHPRKEQAIDMLTVHSIFGSAKASQEADNVLIIQDRRLSSVRGKKYLQVAKNRYTGDLGIMPLEFDKDSLSYRQKKGKETVDKIDETVVLMP